MIMDSEIGKPWRKRKCSSKKHVKNRDGIGNSKSLWGWDPQSEEELCSFLLYHLIPSLQPSSYFPFLTIFYFQYNLIKYESIYY